MRYMLLIYADPAKAYDPASPEGQEEFGQWMRYSQEMAPVTIAGDPLQGLETATTVRVEGGETVLTDGPFAETKEILVGYYIVDVPDLETATQWAARMPIQGRGSVEVRPVMEIPGA